MNLNSLTFADIIGILGLVATVVVGLAAWLIPRERIRERDFWVKVGHRVLMGGILALSLWTGIRFGFFEWLGQPVRLAVWHIVLAVIISLAIPILAMFVALAVEQGRQSTSTAQEFIAPQHYDLRGVRWMFRQRNHVLATPEDVCLPPICIKCQMEMRGERGEYDDCWDFRWVCRECNREFECAADFREDIAARYNSVIRKAMQANQIETPTNADVPASL